MHKKWRLETRIARVQHICLFLINLSAFWIIVRGPPRQLFLSFCSPEWDKTTWMKKNVRNRRSRWEVKVVVQIFESIKKRSYHHFLPIRMFLFFFFQLFFFNFFCWKFHSFEKWLWIQTWIHFPQKTQSNPDMTWWVRAENDVGIEWKACSNFSK